MVAGRGAEVVHHERVVGLADDVAAHGPNHLLLGALDALALQARGDVPSQVDLHGGPVDLAVVAERVAGPHEALVEGELVSRVQQPYPEVGLAWWDEPVAGLGDHVDAAAQLRGCPVAHAGGRQLCRVLGSGSRCPLEDRCLGVAEWGHGRACGLGAAMGRRRRSTITPTM